MVVVVVVVSVVVVCVMAVAIMEMLPVTAIVDIESLNGSVVA